MAQSQGSIVWARTEREYWALYYQPGALEGWYEPARSVGCILFTCPAAAVEARRNV